MTNPNSDYYRAVDLWHEQRLSDLMAEDGWLHLTDRVELEPGQYTLGSGPGNDLQIASGPDHLGDLHLGADGQAMLTVDGQSLAFAPTPEAPPRLQVADLLLEMMRIEGQHALRVRDLRLPRKVKISRFPVDPAWCITARWDVLAAPQQLGIDLVGGIATSVAVSHRASFSHQGSAITLLPTHWKGGNPMFVFRDATSGRQTYGASRFLIGQVQGDTVVLDFNRAFNPPCAFTEFAVCPLPPRENILRFAIPAGELRPGAVL